MRKIDRLIKRFLAEKMAGLRLEQTPDCPSEAKLSDYLHNLLSREESAIISNHIARCLYCLEQLDQAQRISKVSDWGKASGPSDEAISRVKEATPRTVLRNLGRRMEKDVHPACKKSRLFTGLKKHKWLLGSLAALGLSFIFSKFFLQFLAVTVILGVKWAFDTANTRTLIMIYDAWRKRIKK